MVSIDFNLHKIFVEGNTDQACIEKILLLRYGITFPHRGVLLPNAVISCNGWTNIRHQAVLSETYRKENNGRNLVIFDADRITNEGGFDKRLTELNAIAEHIDTVFYIYLFPDNEQHGALEDFYCSCFKKEMQFFDECWTGMIGCLEEGNTNNFTLKLPGTAGKVYSYVDLFEAYRTGDDENKKGKRNYFDDGLWEFDFDHNANLKKLVQFIDDSGIITNE